MTMFTRASKFSTEINLEQNIYHKAFKIGKFVNFSSRNSIP